MTKNALTDKERDFAGEHSDFIYKFLSLRGLDERDYYDIVVPGYLKGVRDYLRKPELQTYEFYTIAKRRMNDALNVYWKYTHRKCRDGVPLSLDAEGPGGTSLGEAISAPNELMREFELQMLLHALATEVTPDQMAVVTLRIEGYGPKAIAQKRGITFTRVNKLLESTQEVVLRLCKGE